jgi:hypothetical protein
MLMDDVHCIAYDAGFGTRDLLVRGFSRLLRAKQVKTMLLA